MFVQDGKIPEGGFGEVVAMVKRNSEELMRSIIKAKNAKQKLSE